MIKEKIASTIHPVIKEISHRWSPRAFSDKPVEQEQLLSVLEAARWAASSRNEQPWRFIVARKGDAHYSNLFKGLNEWNAQWAFTAPVLIVVLAKKEFKPNRPNQHSWHDTGLAVGNLLVQATHLGISAHQMGGIHPEIITANFHINPNEYDVISVIALGYQDEKRLAELNESYRELEYKPRERKPLNEIVFGSKMGKAPVWLK